MGYTASDSSAKASKLRRPLSLRVVVGPNAVRVFEEGRREENTSEALDVFSELLCLSDPPAVSVGTVTLAMLGAKGRKISYRRVGNLSRRGDGAKRVTRRRG